MQTGYIGMTVSVFCGSYSSFKCLHLLVLLLLVFSSAAASSRIDHLLVFVEGLINQDLFPLVSHDILCRISSEPKPNMFTYSINWSLVCSVYLAQVCLTGSEYLNILVDKS